MTLNTEAQFLTSRFNVRVRKKVGCDVDSEGRHIKTKSLWPRMYDVLRSVRVRHSEKTRLSKGVNKYVPCRGIGTEQHEQQEQQHVVMVVLVVAVVLIIGIVVAVEVVVLVGVAVVVVVVEEEETRTLCQFQ